jgi:protein-disulfide isomerase
VTDLPTIMSYGVMSTPALVANEKVLMTGRPGIAKVEQTLRQEVTA